MIKYLVPGVLLLAIIGFLGIILFWFWNRENEDQIKACWGVN